MQMVYVHANVDAAKRAVHALAMKLNIGEDCLVSIVKDMIDTRVSTEILRKLLADELKYIPSGDMIDMIDTIIAKL